MSTEPSRHSNRGNRKQPFSFSKRLYRLRWRIEKALNLEGLQPHRNPLESRLALNYWLRLPRCRTCMVDLISLDPCCACGRLGQALDR